MKRRPPAQRVLRLLLSLALLCLALAWQGTHWLTALEPKTYYEWGFLPDFFQEWASARNYNLSLCGLWHKLLAPAAHWMPVTFTLETSYPAAAFWGHAATSGLLAALTALIVLRRRDDADLAFSAAIVAMLLVSPITWDHYLLLLVLPIALLWQRLPRAALAWPLFLFLVVLLFVEPLVVMQHGLILVGAARSPATGHWLAGPLETLTALSIPCYALVGLFALLFAVRGGPAVPGSSAESSPCHSPPAREGR